MDDCLVHTVQYCSVNELSLRDHRVNTDYFCGGYGPRITSFPSCCEYHSAPPRAGGDDKTFD